MVYSYCSVVAYRPLTFVTHASVMADLWLPSQLQSITATDQYQIILLDNLPSYPLDNHNCSLIHCVSTPTAAARVLDILS